MAQASRKRATDSPVIPDRLYFKIGDVAQICGVETYVLRFWETQFPQLKPNKSGTGQRLYRKRDVETVLEIQRLVHKEGYTIAGAKHALEGGLRRAIPALVDGAGDTQPAEPSTTRRPDAVRATVMRARAELKDISNLLANPQPSAKRERAKVVRVRPETDSLFPM